MFKRIEKNRLLLQWIQQFINTALICFLFTFSEWIFQVTKPSFLSNVDWGQKILVLVKSSVRLSSACFVLLLVLGVVSLRLKKKPGKTLLSISNIVPGLVLASLALLLIDNFTYTVFNFGIITSYGAFRAIYAVQFLVLLYFSFQLFKLLLTLKFKHTPYKLALIGLILLSLIFVIPFDRIETNGTTSAYSGKLPNIILIGSDGLLADHMSVYGYDRETTPNISEFAEDALVVDNNFPNAGNTSGSIISIFTSKYPTETRVLYPPDMLRGSDAVQHLPGLLKNLGYHNVELGAPYYADSNVLGVIHGFDEVNGQVAAKEIYFRLVNSGFSTNDSYFISTSVNRIYDRLLHIFYIKKMVNPYDLLKTNTNLISDKDKITDILSLMDEDQDQPLFIHAHLMGTHGSRFKPEIQVFSTGEEQNKGWMTDFYDDSILNYDKLFGDLIDGLTEKGLLENTIIIAYSDHGQLFKVNTKIPLLIRFPNGEYSNVEINQAENLDIAPTILDYLDVNQPEWMRGSSLIDPNYSSEPVIGVGIIHTVSSEEGGFVQDDSYLTPPFYQFEFINVVDCQKWYRLDLYGYKLTQGTVAHYTHPCAEDELLPLSEVIALFRERLTRDGFTIPKELEAVLNNPG